MPDSTDQDQQAELAYSALKRGIMEFRFAPGERLSPTELRERLGVGRTPVREAIVRLRQEGLVITRPKSGSYVALVDLDAAECARFLRSNTERAVVVECCSRAGEKDVASLRKLLGEQERAMEAHDQRSFFNADNRMHEELYCIAGRQQRPRFARRASRGGGGPQRRMPPRDPSWRWHQPALGARRELSPIPCRVLVRAASGSARGRG